MRRADAGNTRTNATATVPGTAPSVATTVERSADVDPPLFPLVRNGATWADGGRRVDLDSGRVGEPLRERLQPLALVDDVLLGGRYGDQPEMIAVGTNGEVRWRLDVSPARDPVVADGTAYLDAGRPPEVVAADLSDGAVEWRWVPPASHRVEAVATDGTERWRRSGTTDLAPAFDGDRLLHLDRALDPADGSELWSVSTAGPVGFTRYADHPPPAVAGDRAVYTSLGNVNVVQLLAVDRSDGSTVWQREIVARPRSLRVAGDAVVAATEGELSVFRPG